MDWSYVPETSTAKKVAVSAKISYEMRDDFDYMQSEIDNMLRTSLVQERTKQLLTGDGTGVNLKGIFTAAATYTATALDGTVEMANKADAIRAAILQMRNLNFYPDVVMLNPSDRASIDLTKDSTGHYISDELFRLIRGVEIVESTYVKAGDFLVADTSKWNVRPYKGIRVEFGWVDDDFQKNLFTVICEERLHSYFASVDQGAFVKGAFATIIAALQKPAAKSSKVAA